MHTHALQFGQHAKTGAPHSHAVQMGKKFFMPIPKTAGDKHHEALVKQTEKWVSQTFYGELLKQMRNSPFKSKLFSGGQGGEAFTQMYDEKLAEKMSKGAGKKLVNAIVHHIEAQKAYGAASKTAAGPSTDTRLPVVAPVSVVKPASTDFVGGAGALQ